MQKKLTTKSVWQNFMKMLDFFFAGFRWYRKAVGGMWYYNRYHFGSVETACWIWEREPASKYAFSNTCYKEDWDNIKSDEL